MSMTKTQWKSYGKENGWVQDLRRLSTIEDVLLALKEDNITIADAASRIRTLTSAGSQYPRGNTSAGGWTTINGGSCRY